MKIVFTSVLHLPTEDRSAQRSLELHFLKILPKARSSSLATKSHVQCFLQITSDLADLWLDTLWHSLFKRGFTHRYKPGHSTEVFFQYCLKLQYKSLRFDDFWSCSYEMFKSYFSGANALHLFKFKPRSRFSGFKLHGSHWLWWLR